MRRFFSGFFGVWVLLLCVRPGWAQEGWPMFRGGPALCGVSPAPLREPLQLCWSFKTGRAVKSSAALVAAVSGSGGAGAPARVYIGSNNGSLYALDAASGAQLWRFAAEGNIEASPLFCNGTLFFGSAGGRFYALDAADGRPRWQAACDDKILGSANLVSGALLVGGYDNRLHCFEAATGRELWSYDTGNYINGAPAVAWLQGKPHAVFGGCDGKIHLLAVADGKPVREIDTGGYIAGSCAVRDGKAYAGNYNNEVFCADLETGRVLWRFKSAEEEPFFSTPAVTEDRVYIGGRDRKLHALERETGALLWSFATRGPIDSSPVVCGMSGAKEERRILFGSGDGRLYLLNEAGKQVWSYELGKAVGSSPAVAGNRVVIGCDDGSVYALEMPPR